MFDPISKKIDFPALEREVLAFWKEARTFEKSLLNRKGARE